MVSTIQAPLFVPGNRPERFAKAAESGADAVILDLEDAVASDAKDMARAGLSVSFTSKPVLVRINAHGTSYYAQDVAAVTALRPAAVILAKSEDTETVAALATACSLPVIALIESAKGIANVRSIASTPGVARLAFGSIDFCADLGCYHLREILLPARLELVLASRLAGKAGPIDGVTVQMDDPAVIEDDTRYARSLGMTGKLCIHPKQVVKVLEGFAPTEAQVAWARRILNSGDGAVSVDGAMVDEPVRVQARAILHRIEAASKSKCR